MTCHGLAATGRASAMSVLSRSLCILFKAQLPLCAANCHILWQASPPKQHGQVTGLAATAATALPWAAALCTCAAHARHPSTSCLFQQQAVDVFVWRKKETAWLCHRTRPRSFSPPPASPSVRHSCICYQEMKGESTSLHRNYLGKLALRVHNHHSAAQCKMLFFFFFQASCCDCPLQGLSRALSGHFLSSAFQLLLQFFTGQDGVPSRLRVDILTVQNVGVQHSSTVCTFLVP